ncbi:MAG: hypothetical protein JO368_03850, partial [Acidimicrobiales bacterium]|nr:hypothetical protein [Acidimicrobiales bacterium]
MTSAKPVVSLFPPREAPAPTPFDSWGHRRKLRRGAFHIEEAQAACEGWATGDGFRVFAERDGEGGELVQVEMLKPLPDDLPLMVGDALQCLRTSLDRLVCSLAVANKGSLSAKQEDEVWFPISDHRVTERTAAVEPLSKGVR